MQGECIDTRIAGCSIDGYSTGTAISSYCEGLHICDTIFAGGTALETGSTSYNDNTNTNLLGLYISGCEFDCSGTVLSLYQVNSGWFEDSYLNGPQPGGRTVAMELAGSARLTMDNLLFDGQVTGTSSQIAIFATASEQGPTHTCYVNNCQFLNTNTAIVLDRNTVNFIATTVSMYQPSASTLVNGSSALGGGTQSVYVDNSGNTSNNISWLTTSSTQAKASTNHMGYER